MAGAADLDPNYGPAASRRLLTSALCGVVVAIVLELFAPWQVSVLAGWIVTAGLFTARLWVRLLPTDGPTTRRVATLEDNSRALSDLLLIAASATSLVGVGFALVKASQETGAPKVLFTAAGILTVVASWLLVHSVFTLRYARCYYEGDVGGIDFSSKEPPTYHDFAYVAFTIGMTFQVSDTDLTSSSMRRLALRHALLAYLFGAVILALTINITAGFVH